MKSLFSNSDNTDKELIQKTLEGKKEALNELIERHQPYIYNIAWKMVGNPMDAADLSQEAMIKIISNLGSFNFESSFRTWAYRIVCNHFLNNQQNQAHVFASNFQELGNALDSIPNVELSYDEKEEKEALIKETRLSCLSGMLLCLNKEQRLIFIIGELFGADHTIGSEIMEISKPNFRMKLSKARKDLINFMQNKCGLIDKANPCRCHKKVTVNLEAGVIHAKNLLHNRKEFSTFRAQIEPDANYISNEAERKYIELHREHSYKTHFEKKNFLIELLENENWKSRLNLN